MNQNVSYFVKDGHTLGYVYAERPDMMGVLHGCGRRGGHDWRNGPVSTFGADLKVATLEDFDSFRVDPKGHIC